MGILINIYFLFFSLITVLNRGGSAIGFGYLNISLLSLLLSALIYFLITKGKQIIRDLTVFIFISISLIITFNHINYFGLNAFAIRSTGVLIYPLTLLAGISLSRGRLLSKTLNLLKFIFPICIIYGLFATVLKPILINKVIINGISLFGIYGSYYTITTLAFNFFFSGYGGIKNIRKYSLLGAAAILVTGGRAAILGLSTSFFINLNNRTRSFLSKKVIYTLFLSLILILIVILFVFPIFRREGLRNTFTIEYYWKAFLSIFSDSDSFGTGFVGSRRHRILMLNKTLDLIFGDIKNFFFGIPFTINYTGALFNDPHNGLLSLFARGGIFTITSFVFLQFQIFTRALKIKKILGPNPFSTFSLCFIFSSLIFSTVSTMLTAPMNAIPYYFVLGHIWEMNNFYLDKIKIKNLANIDLSN